jgi:hypothetical protein
MGCYIIEFREHASKYASGQGFKFAFCCSVTDWHFGPSFDSYRDAESFLEYCKADPRSYTDNNLTDVYCAWLMERGRYSCGFELKSAFRDRLERLKELGYSLPVEVTDPIYDRCKAG